MGPPSTTSIHDLSSGFDIKTERYNDDARCLGRIEEEGQNREKG